SAETMSSILNEEPQSISQIVPTLSAALPRVVQRCLEKNPERRFQSASDLGFALESLTGSHEVVPLPITPPLRLEPKLMEVGAPRETARPFWPIGLVAVVVLAALAAGIWYWAAPSSPPHVTEYAQITHNGRTPIPGPPIPSRDARKILAVGTPRAELARFDARSKRIEPYLGGISAEFLSFSKDGRQI